MPLTENDLELLETYLDGELSAAEAAALRQRVGATPELAGALELLRTERATRTQAWQSFEPSPLEVDRLADRLERTIGQQPMRPAWDRVLRIGRIVTAAAACLVMGIAIGRVSNGPGLAVAPGVGGGQVAGPAGGSTPQRAQVVLTDDTGRVFVQEFDSLRDAQRFVDDLKRAREQQLREHTGAPVQSPEQF